MHPSTGSYGIEELLGMTVVPCSQIRLKEVEVGKYLWCIGKGCI